MQALTLDALWAWAVIHGEKRVENRTWFTRYRGPLLIHAGRSLIREASAAQWLAQHQLRSLATKQQADSIRGKIIGVVDLLDCVPVWDMPHLDKHSFAHGPWCWMLENPRAIDPVEARGQTRLWLPDAATLARVRRSLA